MKVQSITQFKGAPSMYRGRQEVPSTNEAANPVFKGRLIYNSATAFKAYPKMITSEDYANTFRALA